MDEPLAILEVASVNIVVHEPGQLEGANVAVTPFGSPDAENVGLVLPAANAVMILVTDPPCVTESDARLADRVMLEAKWCSKDPRS